jgi:hypothetical protein
MATNGIAVMLYMVDILYSTVINESWEIGLVCCI